MSCENSGCPRQDSNLRHICLALMGPPGWLLCQLGDPTPARLRGFRLLGRCLGQMSYREASVFGPMRPLIIFGLNASFQGAGYVGRPIRTVYNSTEIRRHQCHVINQINLESTLFTRPRRITCS